jgi:hypothetical protein
MKLVYIEEPTREAKIGDPITDFRGTTGIISHCDPPHKPESTGHVSVMITGPGRRIGYNYVNVWGLEWIDREDRGFIRDHEGGF